MKELEQWTPGEAELLWAKDVFIAKQMKYTKRKGLDLDNPHDEAYAYNVAMVLHYFQENPNPIIALGNVSKDKLSDVVIDVLDWLWWKAEDFNDKITDVEKFSNWVKDVIADNAPTWDRNATCTPNITERVTELIIKMQ